MDKYRALLVYHAFLLVILSMSFLCTANSEEDREVYIVYLGSLPEGVYSPLSHHHGILQRVVQQSSIENVLVRSYRRSFNGFAAKLTDEERKQLANMKEVVSVFQSRTYQLQTTRTWDFMGLHQKTKRNLTIESDVVIGMIDSGIWPESESFTDEGFSPPPKKWKGVCNGGKNFTCNNKLVGARYYVGDSARDERGHGSHTASTAAGNAVKDVSFYGLAHGTARGGVPAARIAEYKVCNPNCMGHDILAAFDDAIADGVDIISISIGFGGALLFPDEDAIAVGAFQAMQKGILTSNSAGNVGPFPGGISSAAPWIMTVAASSIDRRIIDKVVLGNGTTVVGYSVNSFTLNGTSFPLVRGKGVSRNCSEMDAAQCKEGCLDSDLVKGKIVLCDDIRGIKEAYKSGALGSIFYSSEYVSDFSFSLPLASTILYEKQYSLILSYMNSTRDPRGTILKSEITKDRSAPIVAHFSSRGPSLILPEIIKPDISAPGVQVLAAYSPDSSVFTGTPEDPRRVKYNVLSGTSMACPHASGAAAYVKSFHPHWSPAAIKSSLMTTAWPMKDANGSFALYEYGYGSGHINPVQAINPGLVYESSKEDNIRLLCTKYDQARVRRISGDNSTCPTEKGSPLDHNYPSMGAGVETMEPFKLQFHRRVKNVGLAKSTYKAKIFSDSTVDIKVAPDVLSFKSLNEEKTFDVTVVGGGLGSPTGLRVVSAALVWSDGVHNVRSPIVMHVQ